MSPELSEVQKNKSSKILETYFLNVYITEQAWNICNLLKIGTIGFYLIGFQRIPLTSDILFCSIDNVYLNFLKFNPSQFFS